uniref:Mitogen-activated protein kinase kinase kinase 7 n=1 Tax=Arion vulgaris TaxID=1028688 RepID=A0A0B6ZJ47_9EUPU
MDTQPSFIEEIDFQELKFLEIVGKGAFGVVSRAKWRNKDVAVKRIETESEKKAFMQELKQLSRVNHPNIVRLYGACREHPVCLVMEYAEGGSLYNVLHGSGQQPDYTAAHAVSWCLQCARGVEYLHNMKPKALVHRDLKPPNLLLILGGTVLKICDFGTACDVQTHMTNNKGSAAWMAPEVFEGSNYSEKCDVFSWGIILWEVLTRRKPFDEIGGPAFRIMWAVHSGRRPPPIQNLPKPMETLMARCWSGNPPERPSMAEVVRIMSHMYQFFQGGDEPLVISRVHEMDDDEEYDKSVGPFLATPTVRMAGESRTSTISDTLRYYQDTHHAPAAPVVVQEDRKPRGQMSAPPSLAASRESLNDPRGSRSATPVDSGKRFSADITTLDEQGLLENHVPVLPSSRVKGHRRSGSQGTAPDNMQVPQLQSHLAYPTGVEHAVYNEAYFSLEPHLQPIPPCLTKQESMQIFEEYLRLAQEYLRMQAEIAVLTQRKHELNKEREQQEEKTLKSGQLADIEEYTKLSSENESLMSIHRDLKSQVERYRKQAVTKRIG